MKTFKFRTLCCQVGFKKQDGYSAPEIVTLMLVLPAKKQLADKFSLIANKKIPIEKAKSWMIARYKVDESRKLTSYQADDFLVCLRSIRQRAIKNA